jgi:hypothetical protein
MKVVPQNSQKKKKKKKKKTLLGQHLINNKFYIPIGSNFILLPTFSLKEKGIPALFAA